MPIKRQKQRKLTDFSKKDMTLEERFIMGYRSIEQRREIRKRGRSKHKGNFENQGSLTEVRFLDF
jgi:hypothetical protein